MDSNTLMASLLFGLIGMAMVTYAAKTGRLIPAAVGLLLMVVPYFLTSLLLLLLICSALLAAAWFMRQP